MGTNTTINSRTTGAVEDSVKATQPNHPIPVIYISFKMTLLISKKA